MEGVAVGREVHAASQQQVRWVVRVRRLASGPVAIWVFAAAMLTIGAGMMLPDLLGFASAGPPRLEWWLLVPVFAAAEVVVVHLPTLRNAHSHTFREIPAVAGLAFLAPGEYVAAYLLGCGLALVASKQQGVKLFYNLSMFTLEAALGSLAYQAILGSADPDDLQGWLAAVTAVVLTDLFSAIAVTVAISLSENHFDREVLREALGPGLLAAVVNTSMALLVIVLVLNRPTGLPLVAVVLFVLAVAYRAHVRLSAGYSRLQQLYQFVGSAERPANLYDAVATVLADARQVLRAERAELVVLPASGAPGSRRSLDDSGTVRVDDYSRPNPETDAWWAPATLGEPVLRPHTSSTGQPDQQASGGRLGTTDAGAPRDGIAVPLFAEGRVYAVLLVADRSFQGQTFTRDDLLLFETLAAHAAVALDKARLMDRLRRVAAEREHEARHDTLTGLPNRRAFTEALGAVTEESGYGAVLFLDLDDFKDINDTLGHDAGDTLLQRIGQRLKSTAPGMVARLGGDEFAVLLPGLSGEQALDVAHDLYSAVSRPVSLHSVTLVTKVSIGIALLPQHGSDTNEVLRHADVAMYEAKSSSSSVEMYRPENGRAVERKLVLAADLPGAIGGHQFDVYFQPQADATTTRVIGAEALLRWQHPTYGPIPPPEIVALAERVGCLRRLTDTILKKSLHQRAEWARLGFELNVSVNITAQDLSDETLPDIITALLAETTTPAEALTLEITEQGVMREPDRCLAVLDRLSMLGVQLAVDDFGTGYSSLAYLDRLPVNEVKIDKSFVHRIGRDPSDVTIVRSTIALAHDLGMRVVAEGVETHTSWHQVANLGCDTVQGYAMARPMPGHEFIHWLHDTIGPAVRDRTPQRTGSLTAE